MLNLLEFSIRIKLLIQSSFAIYSPVKDTVVTNDRWGLGIPCKHGGFFTCTDRYNPGKYTEKHAQFFILYIRVACLFVMFTVFVMLDYIFFRIIMSYKQLHLFPV